MNRAQSAKMTSDWCPDRRVLHGLSVCRRLDDEGPSATGRLHRSRMHVAACTNRMCAQALYRRPNTSKLAPGHKVFLYMLRKLTVTRPKEVWVMGMTHIPMARGVRQWSQTDRDQCRSRPNSAGTPVANGARLLKRTRRPLATVQISRTTPLIFVAREQNKESI